MPEMPKSPLGKRVGERKTGPATVPGPTFRAAGDSLPCGCRYQPDEDTRKMRVHFCSPHAVTYEMMEALQEAVAVLDDMLNNAPPGGYDMTAAMEADMKAKRVLRKAKGTWRA